MSIQFKPKPREEDAEDGSSIEELYDAWAETLRYYVKLGNNSDGVNQYEILIASLDTDLARQGEP
jgi:hypothetical protein